ncbi:MAG: glutamate 5-kinase [Lutibacter sp.]|jgi:glutamate 5-kinase|nr:glutamate 5-kinase [Lutibacter sp.]
MDRSGKKKILVKIGSNVLTNNTSRISEEKIQDIARQIAMLKNRYDFVIVSSGAIAVAREFVNLESQGKTIKVKQALASIGQPQLMQLFQENFRKYGLFTSQCLLSYADFENEGSRTNIKNTINVLVDHQYIPIINENDTVATDEIKFGDNDKLSALTAALLQVDLLLIATNTYGIYTRESINRDQYVTINQTADIPGLQEQVENSVSSQGTGGMATKIQAADIAQKAGISTWIVNGLDDHFITDTFENKTQHTKILPLES